MTSKRGSQWKTSWRRQKPGVGSAPVELWFFNNFQDVNGALSYAQGSPSPSIGDTTGGSFWIGLIQAVDPAADDVNDRALFRGTDWSEKITSLAASLPLAASAVVNFNTIVAPVPVLNANPPAILQAVVVLFVVRDRPATIPASRIEELWINGQIALSRTIEAPYSADGGDVVQARTGFGGYLNSWAGGNVEPAAPEIQRWFAETRSALAAQEIAGKTLDRFDAALVLGVPVNLVNLQGGGQAMTLTSSGAPPPGANTLIPAVFGY
jgi:hypothetical protein